MSDVDGKFTGQVYDAKGKPIDDWVVFRPKDNVFAAILPLYIAKCVELDCSTAQIHSAARMAERVAIWREDHPELCKNPD